MWPYNLLKPSYVRLRLKASYAVATVARLLATEAQAAQATRLVHSSGKLDWSIIPVAGALWMMVRWRTQSRHSKSTAVDNVMPHCNSARMPAPPSHT